MTQSINDVQSRIDQVVADFGLAFRPSWYPYEYAESFLREHPEVLGDDDLIHHMETLDRSDSIHSLIEETAGRLGVAPDDLLTRFADARLKETGVIVDEQQLIEARF